MRTITRNYPSPGIGPAALQLIYSGAWPGPPEDAWHAHTSRVVETFLRAHPPGSRDDWVMNIGCGGFHYGLAAPAMVCVDVVPRSLAMCCRRVVAAADLLPVEESSFDGVVCVGSVINYSNAVLVLREIRRILRPGGVLVLEFERSESALYWGLAAYQKNYWPVTTQYKGSSHVIWVYSERYIREALARYGLEVQESRRFHSLSAAALRVTGSLRLAALVAWVDHALARSSLGAGASANVVLACKAVDTAHHTRTPLAVRPRRLRLFDRGLTSAREQRQRGMIPAR